MRIPRRFAGALVIAGMVAASLHLTATPASADTPSFCALLEAVRINIESSMAPSWARDIAIDAIFSSKRAAACID